MHFVKTIFLLTTTSLFAFMQAQAMETTPESPTILAREITKLGNMTWYGDANPGPQPSQPRSRLRRRCYTGTPECHEDGNAADGNLCDGLLLMISGPYAQQDVPGSPRS